MGIENLCLFEILQEDHTDSAGDKECYMKVMEMCDIDGDGKIDYLEFIQGAINHRALLNKNNLEIIFNIFDANKDGRISRQEL